MALLAWMSQIASTTSQWLNQGLSHICHIGFDDSDSSLQLNDPRSTKSWNSSGQAHQQFFLIQLHANLHQDMLFHINNIHMTSILQILKHVPLMSQHSAHLKVWSTKLHWPLEAFVQGSTNLPETPKGSIIDEHQ